MTATMTLSPAKVAMAKAKALAMATGRVHAVVTDKAGAVLVTGIAKVKPVFTPREYQGNTAADRSEQDWTEDDYVARSLQIEGDLDAQLDRDAKWFGGWYTEQHVARCASRGVAVKAAKAHGGTVKGVTTTRTVGFEPTATWPQGRTWTVRVRHYEVRWTSKVCYAADGDFDFVPEAETVTYDESGPAWKSDVELEFDSNFRGYPEWEPVEETGFEAYLEKTTKARRKPHANIVQHWYA